ncbi:MAG: amidase [Solirubrobacteraceae bacterium]|nr:amidase [Solirubrobacteraceae bacterium]
MAVQDELAYTTTTELAERIRRRDLSPVEVMDATLQRIEARNPSLTAVVYEGFDEARDAAREAERRLEAGEEVGPLHGVPTAIKDLFDFKPGWPATFGGIPSLRDNRLPLICAWAERMERAGAIIVGKTNSPVMGFRGVTDNYLFGPTGNPFDTTRNSGGSSGGGAASVADGLLTIAEGTDGGGSVRIPASWCGVYGYKQSWGRVPMISRPNAFGATDPFLFEGLLTRTVADAALGLSALAGYDPRDPFSIDEEVDLLAALDRDVAGMRIAYSPDLDVFPVDRRVARVVADAVRVFEEAGAHVEEVKLGIERDQRELSDLWCRLIMPINVATIEMLRAQGFDLRGDLRDELPPEYHRWLDVGYELTALDIARDQVMRTEIFDATQAVFAEYDLLVCPTLAALPVKNRDDGNTVGPPQVEGVEVDPLIGWCLTYLANFTGHPAASIPAGMADGLPVGMQIMGRMGADADVLAASAAFERLRPWGDTYRIPAERPL